jgi:hypothetical protein
MIRQQRQQMFGAGRGSGIRAALDRARQRDAALHDLELEANLVCSNGGAPSVHSEFCAVNKTRTVRRQEDYGLGNLVS